MTKKSLTRDELYLVKLLEIAGFEEIDRYLVGQAMGQNNRSVDNIVRMLAQTNFIKKGKENSIYMTQNGESLVKSLIETGSAI